jgi:hypothetical protein
MKLVSSNYFDGELSDPSQTKYGLLNEAGNLVDLSVSGNGFYLNSQEGSTELASFKAKEVSYTVGQNLTLSGIDTSQLVSLQYYPLIMGANIASLYTPYDPMNYSNTEAGLNDGNTTALVYNNGVSGTGAAGKWFGYEYAQEFMPMPIGGGSPLEINSFAVWDYTNGVYAALSFVFEASDDADFSSIKFSQTFSNDATAGKKEYFLSSPIIAKYLRIRCLTPNHAIYWVITEWELYNAEFSTEYTYYTEGEISVVNSAEGAILSSTELPSTTIKVVHV